MKAQFFNKDYFTLYSTGDGSSIQLANEDIVLVNSTNTNRAYGFMKFYNVKLFDKIKISFDIVGTGKVGIAFEEPSGSITSRTDFDLTGKSQKVNLEFTSSINSTNSNMKQISVGGLSNCICNATIKNLTVKIITNEKVGTHLSLKKPDVSQRRLATLQKKSGVFTIHEGLTHSNCSVVETNTTQLTLTFEEPLNSTRGIAFVNCNWAYDSQKYIIACDSENNKDVKIKFYDLQGNAVLLSNILDNTIFSVLFVN